MGTEGVITSTTRQESVMHGNKSSNRHTSHVHSKATSHIHERQPSRQHSLDSDTKDVGN